MDQDIQIKKLEEKLRANDELWLLCKTLQSKVSTLERNVVKFGYNRFQFQIDVPFKNSFDEEVFYTSSAFKYASIDWLFIVKLNNDDTVGCFLSPANAPKVDTRISFKYFLYGDKDHFFFDDKFETEFVKNDVVGAGTKDVPKIKDYCTNKVTVVIDMKLVN